MIGEFGSCYCTGFYSQKAVLSSDQSSLPADNVVGIFKKPFACETCQRQYRSNKALRLHCIERHKKQVKHHKVRCAIETCTFSCKNMNILMTHLNSAHSISINGENLHFKERSEFEDWKSKVEDETPCRFVRRGYIRSTGRTAEYYYCSRSGYYQPIAQRQRYLKMQGSQKIQRTCPAHVVVRSCVGSDIKVKYIGKHLCHSNRYEQLCHVSLSLSNRKQLAGRLAQQVPFHSILQELRSSMDGRLTRLHMVTRKDLQNVMHSYHLNLTERFHENDYTSVDGIIQGLKLQQNSSVLLYKRQGDETFDVGNPEVDMSPCEKQDFLLGLMDDAQCKMLQQFGTGEMSVVSADSTHGTNGYGFLLATVMVLDENREGYPVAFLFTNRETEAVLKIFLEFIKQKSGIIECNAFMSDMAPQFFNAWNAVMGSSARQLYCAWHVDKAFRDCLQRHIKGNDELRSTIYKQLRALMEEGDETTFESQLPKFMAEVKASPSSAQFADFFSKNYEKSATKWAYCYRIGCGINTNMSLERMHGRLKYDYLGGKKTKRMDRAVTQVIRFMCDKHFEKVIALVKGKYTPKLLALRRRHKHSLGMVETVAETELGKEWVVQSETNNDEMYTVTRVKERCLCNLICTECKACIHLFKCTCLDHSVRFNMCKHIHLICSKYPVVHQVLFENSEEHDESMVIAEDTMEQIQRSDQLSAHVEQLAQPTTDVDKERSTGRQLCNEIVALLDKTRDLNELKTIVDSLKSIMPKIEALRASQSNNFVYVGSAEREPSNKGLQKQRRFVSTQKKRVTKKGSLSKPSSDERRTFQMQWAEVDLIRQSVLHHEEVVSTSSHLPHEPTTEP
jgi:hypothetical protein